MTGTAERHPEEKDRTGRLHDGFDVTEAFLNYARPLIQGQVEVPQKDGLPYFAFRNGK